jgi:prepilin-type N-terminal cleavage/methylation domain-containing protein
MRKYNNAFKGFTLIELVAVMVIAGVLIATAGSRLSTAVFDERWLFEDALSGARYAQAIAMASGCAVQFSIDRNSFELKHDLNCRRDRVASFVGQVFRPLSSAGVTGVEYKNNDFPAGLVVSAATVVFYPQGWACSFDGRQSSTLSIFFAGSSNHTLNIECGTGFIYGS